jgi:zinc transporter ZupT
MARFLEVDDHDDEGNDKPWGDIIAASLIINLVTFSGILLTSAVGCFSRLRGNKGNNTDFWNVILRLAIPSFAAGALLATTVFLLVPEAFELLAHASEEEEHSEDHSEDHVDRALEEEDHDEHSGEEAQWKFGVALLFGFLFPILIGAIFPQPDLSECEECIKSDDDDSDLSVPQVETDKGEEEGGEEPAAKVEKPLVVKEAALKTDEHREAGTINWALASSILLGDGFHNFTDGIFLGNAFVLCSRDIAYTLVATTVYHELAQEIADYFLLTHHCGMSTRQALVLNFLSGFSVMFGAVLIVALDLSEQLTGALLSVSAGVYIYIAAVECIPRIQAARKDARDTLLFLLCFTIGAIPIGLVLLNHGHCEPEHDDHDERRM